MDTVIHAIARERIPVPPGAAAGSRRRGDRGVAVEPLKLEVCLFDNGELFSPSSAAPWSALIGCGTLILAPSILAAGVPAEASSGRREVALYGPGSGGRVASVDLEVAFSSHHGSSNERITEPTPDLSKRLPTVRMKLDLKKRRPSSSQAHQTLLFPRTCTTGPRSNHVYPRQLLGFIIFGQGVCL